MTRAFLRMNRCADFSPQDPGTDPRVWTSRELSTTLRSRGLKSAHPGGFMAPMRGYRIVEAAHEPQIVEAGFQPASEGGILPPGWEAGLTGSQGWPPLQFKGARRDNSLGRSFLDREGEGARAGRWVGWAASRALQLQADQRHASRRRQQGYVSFQFPR